MTKELQNENLFFFFFFLFLKNFKCRVKLVVALITASFSAFSASVNEGFDLTNIMLEKLKNYKVGLVNTSKSKV